MELKIKKNKIYQGDWVEVMKSWEDKCVDMVLTSPPYWNLRDYQITGQLGLEPTFEEYIDKLCSGFDEVKRVLKDEGTCWVNMGDTYSGSKEGNTNASTGEIGKPKYAGEFTKTFKKKKSKNVPTKSLVQIPSRFSIEMVNRGWILRNVIIWHKPNCMPQSAKDRFTVDFEYLFLFSKKKKYYFERQFEPSTYPDDDRKVRVNIETAKDHKSGGNKISAGSQTYPNRNKRCVWKIPTHPFPDAHFAVYPEKLCITPIRAGCPEQVCKKCGKGREKILEPTEDYKKHLGKSWHPHKDDMSEGDVKKGKSLSSSYRVKGYTKCSCNTPFRKGIVLDPFFGAGTTGVVARKLGRNYIGIELSKEYIKIAEKRLAQQTLL